MNEQDIQTLREIVIKELDACGYFMGDYNIHNLKVPNDWQPYSSKSFGEMLMDFACQYNMEFENKNYTYSLVENKHEKLV